MGMVEGADVGLKVGTALAAITEGVSIPVCVLIGGLAGSVAQSNIAAKACGCSLIGNVYDIDIFRRTTEYAYQANLERVNYVEKWNQFHFNPVYNKITVPQRLVPVKRIGEDHNGLTNTMLRVWEKDPVGITFNASDFVNVIPPVDVSETVITNVLDKDNFDFYLNLMLRNFSSNFNNIYDIDFDRYIISSHIESPNVKEALMLYVEAYRNATSSVDDIVELSNKYIEIIENYDEYDEEEKMLLYGGFTVSAYSPQLWGEVLGGGF